MQKNKYLKGSTIMEVLIALVIISFCAALSVIIYLNIQKSSLPFFKIKADELASNFMNKTIEKKLFTDESIKSEEFTLKKTVERHPAFGDCYLIRILVFDGTKKKIYELENTIVVEK